MLLCLERIFAKVFENSFQKAFPKCVNHWHNLLQWMIFIPVVTESMVSTKSIDSKNSFFSFFPRLFASKFQDFPRTLTKFQDFPRLLRRCTNSNNKISFLQDKIIHPVVYINNSSFYRKTTNICLSYNILYIIISIFHSWELSLILTFWLKDWKAESNYWTWFFSQYKWTKDGVYQVCLAFFGTT